MNSAKLNLPETVPLITFELEKGFEELLREFPWYIPILDWKSHGVRHLEIKRGIGRHPVIFVEVGGRQFVIKELSSAGARNEIDRYREMLRRGIHTLVPVGSVVREERPILVETKIGLQRERQEVGHSVTLLVDRVLPDSLLYRRSFRKENRLKIWDAVVDLFVEMHTNGVYWGDASLANTLVKFLKEDIPHIGKRTILRAVLADAETVEIHERVSDSLRLADVQFFLESMEWIDEDLRASGILREELASAQDRAYILNRYEEMFASAVRALGFEERTGIRLKTYLGRVRNAADVTLLEKHIDEHKWYLSEEEQREVSRREAALDWEARVFVPMCELFRREGIVDLFPGKSAAELYIEMMTHKYYLSERAGEDVGMLMAVRDYLKRHSPNSLLTELWQTIAEPISRIFHGKYAPSVRAHWPR